jgi:hypothetical protein
VLAIQGTSAGSLAVVVEHIWTISGVSELSFECSLAGAEGHIVKAPKQNARLPCGSRDLRGVESILEASFHWTSRPGAWARRWCRNSIINCVINSSDLPSPLQKAPVHSSTLLRLQSSHHLHLKSSSRTQSALSLYQTELELQLRFHCSQIPTPSRLRPF